MPDPAAPTKQELAVIVGTYLTGLDQLEQRHRVILYNAQQQLKCQRANDLEAVRRIGQVITSQVELAQELDRSLEPLRLRWYAAFEFLPAEARGRADHINIERGRLNNETFAVQAETIRLALAMTSPLDRPGAVRDCRELAIQPRPNESGRLMAAAIEDPS